MRLRRDLPERGYVRPLVVYFFVKFNQTLVYPVAEHKSVRVTVKHDISTVCCLITITFNSQKSYYDLNNFYKNFNFLFKISILLVLMCILSGCVRSGLSVINGMAAIGSFEKHTNIAYGNSKQQQLDIYTPKKTASPTPVVVFFYGGCWGACRTYNKNAYDFVGDTFTAAGYTVVLTDYRLYPDAHFDDIMQDAAASVRWTHTHIENYGGDPENIFLMGHSAGAHIASLLTTNAEYLNQDLQAIQGFIGLAGPYDFLPFDQDYMRELFAQRHAESQPINFVDGDEPPHLLLHGLADRRVDPRNAESLAQHLQQNNIDHQHITYADLGHGKLLAALSRPLKNRYPVTQDIIQFIQKHAK